MACLSRACPYPAAALLCHLGPLLHFKLEIGLGLLPTAAGERATGTPTSVTALGGILVGDGRVEAGVSESWPAMSDSESGFLTNYSRPGPTIIRDYSRRPRRGCANAPEWVDPANLNFSTVQSRWVLVLTPT